MAKKQSATSPAVTFSPEQLQAYVDDAIAKAFAVKQAQEDHKRSGDMEATTVKAFRRAGYKPEDIQPRLNIMTYNRWIEAGRKVKEGEKSVKVKNLRLFHVSQTEAITAKAKATLLAEREARRAAKPAVAQPAA